MPADADSSLHAIAGHSGAVDAAAEAGARGLLYAGVAVFALLWLHRQALRAGVAALVGALVGLGVGSLLGDLWDRPRPFVTGGYAPLVAHAADASFPSDHLIAMGALTAAAWLAWRRLGAVLAALSLLLAVCRAEVGIHYLSDLAGGFALGAAATLAAWVLLGPFDGRLAAVDDLLVRSHLRPATRR